MIDVNRLSEEFGELEGEEAGRLLGESFRTSAASLLGSSSTETAGSILAESFSSAAAKAIGLQLQTQTAQIIAQSFQSYVDQVKADVSKLAIWSASAQVESFRSIATDVLKGWQPISSELLTVSFKDSAWSTMTFQVDRERLMRLAESWRPAEMDEVESSGWSDLDRRLVLIAYLVWAYGVLVAVGRLAPDHSDSLALTLAAGLAWLERSLKSGD